MTLRTLLSILLLAFCQLSFADSHASEQQFPDVIAVEVSQSSSGFRFEVTISSPYDTAQRYADAWRIMDAEGNVYGVRELLHDHGYEQPFTRSLSGVDIPVSVTEVIVEGRDQKYGWGGGRLVVELPPRL